MKQVNKIPWLKKRFETKDPKMRKELQTDLPKIKERLNAGKCNFKLYIAKAAAELLLGMPEQAIESAKSALTINPDSFYGWYLLGNGYLVTGQVHSAKVTYDTALKLFPRHGDILGDMKLVRDIYDCLQIISILENSGEA